MEKTFRGFCYAIRGKRYMSQKEHWCALLRAKRVFISQNAMMMMMRKAALPVFYCSIVS